MDNLDASYEEVADWCEVNLGDERGHAVGMNIAAIIRDYGYMNAVPSLPFRLSADERNALRQQLSSNAAILSQQFKNEFRMVYDQGPKKNLTVQPSSIRTNMIYDAGTRTIEPPIQAATTAVLPDEY